MEITLGTSDVTVRDVHNLDPNLITSAKFVHKSFDYLQIATDSNEREMVAGCEVILASLDI